MKPKTLSRISAICCFILSLTLFVSAMGFADTHAATDTDSNSLKELIEDTIDSDRNTLNNLSPTLQKLFNKLISAFKKLGTLSKEISNVVNLYNNLDETKEDYPDKLQEFFTEYNKLSAVKRKVVDFCTGVLDAKDKLLASIGHVITIDLYSEKTIKTELNGSITFTSNNESIASVSGSGIISPKGIGFTSIIAKSSNGEEETYRIIVKKPLLSTKVSVAKGGSVTVSLPSYTQIKEVASSNNKISFSRNGLVITISGLKKGTSYLYVGTKDGDTLKYKVKIS